MICRRYLLEGNIFRTYNNTYTYISPSLNDKKRENACIFGHCQWFSYKSVLVIVCVAINTEKLLGGNIFRTCSAILADCNIYSLYTVVQAVFMNENLGFWRSCVYPAVAVSISAFCEFNLQNAKNPRPGLIKAASLYGFLNRVGRPITKAGNCAALRWQLRRANGAIYARIMSALISF